MSKPKITKRRYGIALIVVAAGILYFGWSFMVPRVVTSFLENKFPEVFAVKEAIESEYPDKKMGFHVYENDRERILAIKVIGERHLNLGEKEAISMLMCSELGEHAKKYDEIILEDTKEHRFLFFYSRQNETYPITC